MKLIVHGYAPAPAQLQSSSKADLFWNFVLMLQFITEVYGRHTYSTIMKTDMETVNSLFLQGSRDKNMKLLKDMMKMLGVQESNTQNRSRARKCQSSIINRQTSSSCSKRFSRKSTIFLCDKGHSICRDCNEINNIFRETRENAESPVCLCKKYEHF